MYDLLLGTLLFTGAVLTGDTVMLDRSIAILQEAAAFKAQAVVRRTQQSTPL